MSKTVRIKVYEDSRAAFRQYTIKAGVYDVKIVDINPMAATFEFSDGGQMAFHNKQFEFLNNDET